MTTSNVSPAKPLDALFRPALVLMTGRMIGFVAAFLIPIVLARLFDQTDFGTYKQLFLIYGTLFGVAQMGMAESLYYFLPSRTRDAGRFVFNSLMTLGALGLASLAGLWLFRDELAVLMNNPAIADLILPLGLFLMLMLMAAVIEIIMTIRKQYVAASSTYALTDLARATLYVVPVILVPDLRVLMLGAVVFALARFLATLVYVGREFGSELRPDRHALSEQVGYAVSFGVAAIIGTAQGTFHLYAVSNAFDAATFAVYAVGCLQIPLYDLLKTSTSNVMMVSMRERLLDDDFDGAIAVWLDGNRKLALVFYPIVVGLVVMAHPFIVLLYTDTYEASVPIFIVWTLSMLLISIMTDTALRVFALVHFLIFKNLFALVLVVLNLHWAMDRFGLMGAVMVTLMAAVAMKVMALERVRRALKVGYRRLLPWRPLGVTFFLSSLAALPTWAITAYLKAPELVVLMVAGPTFVLAYYVLLKRFGPLQEDEQEQIEAWIRKPLIWVGRAT